MKRRTRHKRIPKANATFKALLWPKTRTSQCARGCGKVEIKKTEEIRDSPFPLPDNVQNLSRAPKSDQINFQTTLGLESILRFYRDAFSKQGLVEQKLLTNFSKELCQLVFEKPLSDRVVVIQAIDLAYGTSQDLRNVNIRTRNRVKARKSLFELTDELLDLPRALIACGRI